MTRYLLGELSERERDELGERYFSDDELFGELLDAQDQLVDDYLHGHPSQRERFEQRFLTLPGRRREVEFSILLAESLSERRASGLPTPNVEPAPQRQSLFSQPLFNWMRASRRTSGWALAAATLIVVLGVGWLALNISRPQVQPASSPAKQVEQIEQARKERVGIEEELARLQTRPVPANALLSFTLTRGASRNSGEIKKVTPGPETQAIALTLEAGAENYAGYQASLQKADDESAGIPIKPLQVKTTAAGKSVIVRLPAAMLKTADYQIKLEGIGPQGGANIIGKYLFQVRRQ